MGFEKFILRKVRHNRIIGFFDIFQFNYFTKHKKLQKFTFVLVVLVAICTSNAFSQTWEMQNPKPTNNNLQSAYFLDTQTGWAAGNAGTIVKTTDGGKNWTNESVFFNNEISLNFSSIHFFNEQTGWLVGYIAKEGTRSQGIIFKTTNGGMSWDTNFVLSSDDADYYFNETFFIDSQNFYVVGGKFVNGIPTAIVYITTNGGESWFSGNVDNQGMSADFFSICFIDDKNGWAVGHSGFNQGRVIFKTSDGGVNWTRSFEKQEYYGYLNSIYFTDNLNGWACGAKDPGNNSSIGVIMHTTDGGINWIENESGTFLDMAFNSIIFKDNLNGVITGYAWTRVDVEGGFYWQLNAYILKTSDGGVTYLEGKILDENDIQININYALKNVFFTDSQNGSAVGEGGTILTTSDGGSNWYQQNQNQINTNLDKIIFTDSLNGWITGSNSYDIFKTSDGGKRWNKCYTDSLLFFHSISFPNRNNGWFVGEQFNDKTFRNEGYAYNTIDGGENWNLNYQLTIENDHSFFRYVFFLDSLTGWIGGGYYLNAEGSADMDPLILKTTDGGSSWNLVTSGVDIKSVVSSIFFIDSNNGWACGNQIDINGQVIGKTIFRTTNGGSSWVNSYLEEPPNFGYLNSVHFSNELNGWATGTTDTNGVILKTNDGGYTWSEVKINYHFANYSGPVFVDDQTGWLSGYNYDEFKPVLHTENGGRDWIAISRLSANFANAYFTDRKHGWAVGNNGLVEKYIHHQIYTAKPDDDFYCTGETIRIPYELKNDLPYDITFVAQISDSTGSFKYSPVIGQSEGNKSGYIDAIIPDKLPQGNYRVRVWGSENSFPFSVLPAPSPKILGPVNVCTGTPVTYTASDSLGTSYEWEIEGGTIQGSKTGYKVNVVWDIAGYGKLSVIESNVKPSCQGYAELKVKINGQGGVPNLSINGPNWLCFGDSDLQEYSNNDRDVINTWSVSGGKIIGNSVGSRVKIQFEPGIDTVFLQQEVLTGGCINKIFKVVRTDTNNISRKIAGDIAVCSGRELKYTTTDKGVNSYKWYADEATFISDDSSETLLVSFSKTGYNYLILKVSSPLGCTKSDTLVVDVDLSNIGILGDSTVCKDSGIVYSYYAKYKGLDCEWSLGGGYIIGPNDLDSVLVRWREVSFKVLRLTQSLEDGCSDTKAMSILGFKMPELTLSIPEIKANPAEFYDKALAIPINIDEMNCKANYEDTDTINIRIKIDKSLFLPLKKEGISWIDVGDWRQITIVQSMKVPAGIDNKYELEGYLLLGNKIESAIIIESVSSNISGIKIATTDGKLILEGIPEFGGLRLLSKRSFELQSIMPNPNDGSFEVKVISLIEQSIGIKIVDVLGNVIENFKTDIPTGESVVDINNLDVTTGNYLLLMENNEGAQSIRVLIQR